MNMEPLKPDDINLLADLQPEGWPDITPSIAFYLNSKFCYPQKVILDHKIVGIGTFILHHDVAWLAHIIVHPDYRKRGIGQKITQTLTDQLKSKNYETIYLIATDLGAPVYEKIGFETETEYLFFKDIKVDANWSTSENIHPFKEGFKEQIAILDQKVSGENRMFHMEEHLQSGFIYQHEKVIQGFFLPTWGDGLIISDSPSAGIELMKMRMSTKDHANFPVDNIHATAFMYSLDYKEFRKAKRMRLGTKRVWQPKNIYNRIGGNLG